MPDGRARMRCLPGHRVRARPFDESKTLTSRPERRPGWRRRSGRQRPRRRSRSHSRGSLPVSSASLFADLGLARRASSSRALSRSHVSLSLVAAGGAPFSPTSQMERRLVQLKARLSSASTPYSSGAAVILQPAISCQWGFLIFLCLAMRIVTSHRIRDRVETSIRPVKFRSIKSRIPQLLRAHRLSPAKEHIPP